MEKDMFFGGQGQVRDPMNTTAPTSEGGGYKSRRNHDGPPRKAGPTRAGERQEHSQKCPCHKKGLVEDDGAGFGYVGVEFVD